MIRTVLAIVPVAAIALGVSVAIAQQDIIKQRKDLMKANGDQAKIGADMLKGAKPFDLAAVHKIFATFENAAAKMPNLFPPDSKDEASSSEADKYSPKPAVWENMADFKKRFEKLGADAKAAGASVKDLATFKAAFANIGKNDCGSCHKTYRAQKS